MSAALIMITILGCNDGLTQCQYLDTATERYASPAACGAMLEYELAHYKYNEYTSVVAVCQNPDQEVSELLGGAVVTGMPGRPSNEGKTDESEHQVAKTDDKNRLLIVANRWLDAARSIVPDKKQVNDVLTAPIHVVKDSYSWVAKKISR